MARTEDSHLAKQAEATAAQLPGQGGQFDQVELAIPEPLAAIPVRNESAAQAIARCVTLSAANPVLLLLPQDPRRRSAILLSVDNDVYVCSSLELAQNVQGVATSNQAFYLPSKIAVPVTAKGALWAAVTTTGTASRISVLIAKDDG